MILQLTTANIITLITAVCGLVMTVAVVSKWFGKLEAGQIKNSKDIQYLFDGNKKLNEKLDAELILLKKEIKKEVKIDCAATQKQWKIFVDGDTGKRDMQYRGLLRAISNLQKRIKR